MPQISSFQFDTHAERLFVELGREEFRSQNGLPIESNDWNGAPQQHWSVWNDVPCHILLGEPGIGKTREFEYQYQILKKNGHKAFFSRWQDWNGKEDLLEILNDERASFEEDLSYGNQPAWWFIDSLDEGRIKTSEAFDFLLEALKSLHKSEKFANLKLRLSCRSRDWRPTEQEKLSRFFSFQGESDPRKPGVVAVTLLPLTENVVRLLALEKLGNDQAVNNFIQAMTHRHIIPLSGQPLLLGMMLSLFHENGLFGKDRTEIYKKTIEKLAAENNRYRGDRDVFETNPEQRLSITKKLASFMVFGAFETTAVPDRDEISEQTLDASVTGEKKQLLLETLNTGLFSQGAEHHFRFVHRSIGEYLAASALVEKLDDGLRLARVLPIFWAPQGDIPSPLRETAGWLAGFNPHFREWLIDTDPMTAALGDTIRYTPEDRERIIEMLAQRFANRNWQGEYDRFGDLGRSVDPGVLQRLTGGDQGPAVRHLAIDLVNTAERNELFPGLMEIAGDPSVAPGLRSHAIRVLITRSPAQFASQLSNLLPLSANEDPEDEIAGTILHGLYPDHLSSERALSGFYPPRNPRLYGNFRYFWEFEFCNRIHLEDCPSALDTIEPLLPTSGSFHQNIEHRMAYARIFTGLIQRVLSIQSFDIGRLGSWLVRIREWEKNDSIAENEMERQGLAEHIKNHSDLKKRLIEWRLSFWPEGKMLNPWYDMPYPPACTVPEDFDFWVEIFRQFSQKENIGKPVLGYLWNLMLIPESTLHAKLEMMEELATLSPSYLQLWNDWRFSSFDGQQAQYQLQERLSKISQQTTEDQLKKEVCQAIPQFRSGHIGYLFWLSQKLTIDHFGDPPLNEIAQRFGEEVVDAVREGFLQAWNNPMETSELWTPSRSVTWPSWAIMSGFGLALSVDDGLEWVQCSSHQIDLAIWLAIRNPSRFPNWFPALWSAHRSTVWKRMVPLLDEESGRDDSNHPSMWCKLAQAESLPDGMLTELVDYLVSQGLSLNRNALAYQLRLALKAPKDSLIEYLSSHARSYWNSDRIHSELEEAAALMVLAAWWILDSLNAHTVLEQQVLTGERSKKRVIGFVTAIQELAGEGFHFLQTWPSHIPWESYVALLPLLYTVPPRSIPVTTTSPTNFISDPSIGFFESRTTLITHIANGPPEKVRKAFAQWIQDDRFGEDRDWFARLHAEICQREIDSSWMPPSSKDLVSILNGKASLVNSDNDLFILLCDLIDSDLRQVLHSDISLVPLLWEGTKKDGRSPSDEKSLQTVFYNQIMLLLKNWQIIGAREPEVFDAKKPDLRVSCSLSNDLIIHIPIEIKWSHHDEVWTAIEDQLVCRYMQDPNVRYGLYLVGWDARKLTLGPQDQKPETPEQFEFDLREIGEEIMDRTGKNVGIYVLDCTV